MKIRTMEKKIVTEKDELYIREAIKKQFYYLKMDDIRLSADVIYRLIQELHYKIDYLAIVKYLESIGFKESPSVQLFYYKSKSYRELIPDEDRVFDFHISSFLTEVELIEFRKNN